VSVRKVRKNNVTGIARLAIGTTKNYRGLILTRYVINYVDTYGFPSSKSYYFGKRNPQKKAFHKACDFLESIGQTIGSRQKRAAIYRKFDHENLIKKKAD
jgi:hypothetical protein